MQIIHVGDHYVVLDDNGKFVCSADTLCEAARELEEAE